MILVARELVAVVLLRDEVIDVALTSIRWCHVNYRYSKPETCVYLDLPSALAGKILLLKGRFPKNLELVRFIDRYLLHFHSAPLFFCFISLVICDI